jgi:hypothetical protein
MAKGLNPCTTLDPSTMFSKYLLNLFLCQWENKNAACRTCIIVSKIKCQWQRAQHERNSSSICTEVTGVLSTEWRSGGVGEQWLNKARKVKNQEVGGWPMWNPSRFLNWQYWTQATILPESGRQEPYLTVGNLQMSDEQTKFFGQSWVFTDKHFKKGEGYPRDAALSCKKLH